MIGTFGAQVRGFLLSIARLKAKQGTKKKQPGKFRKGRWGFHGNRIMVNAWGMIWDVTGGMMDRLGETFLEISLSADPLHPLHSLIRTGP